MKNDSTTNKVYNPLKGKTQYGWHFEQEVYLPCGIARALKAGGGSGNIPKVILFDEIYYSIEDGNDNCITTSSNKELAIEKCKENPKAKEVFEFRNDDLVGCVYRKDK